MVRVLLVGGGSGGHVEPLMLVGAALKARRATVGLVSLADPALAARCRAAGFKYFPITAGKLRRYPSVKSIAVPLQIMRGYLAARRIFKTFGPDVVFSKGGFVSVPVVFAAGSTPVILHESDVVMGLSNRLLARRAKMVLLGFPLSEPAPFKTRVVGIPVSSAFTKRVAQSTKPASPALQPGFAEALRQGERGEPQIVFAGGSQGAHAINETVFAGIHELTKLAHITHITGVADHEHALSVRAGLPPEQRATYEVHAFTEEFAKYLQQAWVYVGRAGATTLAELSAARLAAILVPLPSAAQSHQLQNARYFERAGAAYLLKQTDLTAARIEKLLRYLIEHPKVRRALTRAIGKLDHPHATEEIVAAILKSTH